jgi:DNA-binding beta-propeller fold protein YncE
LIDGLVAGGALCDIVCLTPSTSRKARVMKKHWLVSFSLGLSIVTILLLLGLIHFTLAQGSSSTILFVDNGSASAGASVLIYDGMEAADGNVTPTHKLWNPLAAVPHGVWYDPGGDWLFVSVPANHCILIFDHAHAAGGPSRPDRIIVGPATLLNYPYDLFFDAAHDRLYVASYLNSRILVFDNASSANGNAAPTRSIGGPVSTLYGPRGLTLDLVADWLYVANSYANTIVIFNNASTLNGDAAPTRVISGSYTLLNDPRGIEVDATHDQLYVVNRTDSSDDHRPVVVFTATIASGNITPTRSIAHDDLFYPTGSFLLSDTLYIATEPMNGIYIYDHVSAANGILTPTRQLGGPGGVPTTTLIVVRNLFVDPAGDKLYVANYKVSNVTGYVPVFANAHAITGSVAPERIIEDASRLGFDVMDLVYDAAHDRLYVLHDPNEGSDSIQVYDQARNVAGDVPPTRLLTTTFLVERGMAMDLGRDQAYIFGWDPGAWSNGLGVFIGLSSASGQITPTRLITSDIWLDSQVTDYVADVVHDRLYILRSTYPSSTIAVLENVSSAHSEIVPSRIISGPHTLLDSDPLDMAFDPTGDRLYVSADSPGRVLVFNGISSASGDVAPTHIISGAHALFDFPGGLAVDAASDTLYVSNAGYPAGGRPSHISIFANASSANGDVSPSRVISGSVTSLYTPRSLAVGVVSEQHIYLPVIQKP